eukprot:CAMPEP_0174385698 /NCGR_PEP_ID=MMETSP0811_2-20130205/126779_1 /TAXON_ID=73025 ORGANISM="Eutreptiella gymnastica-like, Strain CCMP1594" /NCGR_SAMPLE_ID=MMETSP0811_2 /ASSEMBLY_ACC=CAM_ASM_000667 /LENGTH=77 /DNA_ID=CAMNT_0015540115 /DNA_START=343 /DNA_END=576 /DNA_ORIENTATION=+
MLAFMAVSGSYPADDVDLCCPPLQAHTKPLELVPSAIGCPVNGHQANRQQSSAISTTKDRSGMHQHYQGAHRALCKK